MSKNNPILLSSVIIAIGLFLLGREISKGIFHLKDSERVISVKGLSEKEVLADQVIWPIVYKVASNDIAYIYKNTELTNTKILKFLTNNGISETEVTVSPVSVIDSEAERYSSSEIKYRYKATLVVTVASDKVELIRKIMSKQGQLLKEGIALSEGDYQYPTLFSFNGLNDIKPQMIEEATKNARTSAIKFAEDSDSELGKIRTANQGQFSITNRDNNTPHIKIVRVVTTIQYFLKD